MAERRVKSDRANWTISYSVTGAKRDEIPSLYEQAECNKQTIFNLLKENGFEDSEIELGVLDYNYSEFRDDKQNLVDQVYELVGTISVETQKVDLVSKARTSVNSLIAKGIDIENNPPTYRFTKLNDIKPDMLREATKNARIAANEFAEDAEVKVGGIYSAQQGSFYVQDAGESYGDTAKIEKDVRVVTTITFYLNE